MYKLILNSKTNIIDAISIQNKNMGKIIPFDPANTDYQAFKKDILDGAALQDAEGNTMSAEQATQFVKELP